MTKNIKNLGKEIKELSVQLISNWNKELYSKTQKELESYWYFDFNKVIILNEITYYEFFKALESYRSICRNWETHHNGHTCVVERVRDKYILPKINLFQKLIKKHESIKK